jgi:phosphoribosylformylglycinamidine synthase
MNFSVSVDVRGVDGIADPEGRTIERALGSLGYSGTTAVRVGKTITFNLVAEDEANARQTVREMCDRLLANPVIESYVIAVEAI